MKQAIRHITIFLLTVIVLISSTGVSVHRLYCYCKGEVTASLFCQDDPCERAAASVEKTNCCKSGKCESPAKKQHHDCSDCTSEYVKLDVKYLVFTAHFEIIAPVAALPTWTSFDIFSFAETSKICWEQDIPPRAGKELLPWIQAFLC